MKRDKKFTNVNHKLAYLYVWVALLHCASAVGGFVQSERYYSKEHGVHAKKIYRVKSIVYEEQERKLYVLGHVETSLEMDDSVPPEEPKILQYSETGKFEGEIYAAFFGLEDYARTEHKHDFGASQTWFVDPVNQIILKYPGSPVKASSIYEKDIQRGPGMPAYISPRTMSYYGFSVSITQKPAKMWIKEGTSGHGPLWVRDKKNGLLWDQDEGLLKIRSDADTNDLELKVGDWVSAIFPDNRDGTAWVYLSHKYGELVHYDRKGKVLGRIPLVKFRGQKIPIVIDFQRDSLWFMDPGYPCKLYKISLAGEKKLELSPQEITGERSVACFNSKISLQNSDGGIWIYFPTGGIIKLDSSGKRVQKIVMDNIKLPVPK